MVRLAIAMVLQHPELAAKVTDRSTFVDQELPGMPLFLAVLDLLQGSPGLNTAAVIEHFRGTEHEAPLAKLAVWQHPALRERAVATHTLSKSYGLAGARIGAT